MYKLSLTFWCTLQNMFELSSRLIGIYKVANQTRSVAIGTMTYAREKNLHTDSFGCDDR